jgi:hypothetical protein
MRELEMKPNSATKSVLVLFSGVAELLYLFFLGGSIYEAVVFPRAPQKVTLAQAVEMDLQNQPAFLVFDQTLYVPSQTRFGNVPASSKPDIRLCQNEDVLMRCFLMQKRQPWFLSNWTASTLARS